MGKFPARMWFAGSQEEMRRITILAAVSGRGLSEIMREAIREGLVVMEQRYQKKGE